MGLPLSVCNGSDSTTKRCMATAGWLHFLALWTSKGHGSVWLQPLRGLSIQDQVKRPLNMEADEKPGGQGWWPRATMLLSEVAGVRPLLSVVNKKSSGQN